MTKIWTAPVIGPDRLYRYRPLVSAEHRSWLRQIICDSTMFASGRDMLNDRDDCIVRLEAECSLDEFFVAKWAKFRAEHIDGPEAVVKAAFREHYEQLMSPDFVEDLTKSLQTSVDGFGVVCFSPASDLPGQWREYAAGGAGVCLVFDPAQDPSFFRKVVPVDYVDPLPTAHVLLDSSEIQVRKCLYTKSSKWEQEQEFRALFTARRGTQVAFKPDALVEVVMGTNISAADRQFLEECLAERLVGANVALTECQSVELGESVVSCQLEQPDGR